MAELTKEDYKKILQDCGFHRIKAMELSGRLKEKIDGKMQEKKVKVVMESKNITEPKNSYKKIKED